MSACTAVPAVGPVAAIRMAGGGVWPSGGSTTVTDAFGWADSGSKVASARAAAEGDPGPPGCVTGDAAPASARIRARAADVLSRRVRRDTPMQQPNTEMVRTTRPTLTISA